MFENFNKRCLKDYFDPHNLTSVSERVIWAFIILKEQESIERLTISNIANFLTEIIEIDTSPQAVRYAINHFPRGYLNEKKKTYKLMEKGKQSFKKQKSSDSSFLVTPGESFSSKKLFVSEIVNKSKGIIKICDPYVGIRLLDLLVDTKTSIPIQILTQNIDRKNNGLFERTLIDMQNEGYNIEVRLYSKSILHDRYVIDEETMWLIGHSIKDLGKKECFIVKVGSDLRGESLNLFNRRWKASEIVK